MQASTKKFIAKIFIQTAFKVIEHEIKASLKQKGFEADDLENLFKKLLEANNASKIPNVSPSNKPLTINQAFKELGLTSQASPDEIKSKFKKLVLENHTDQTKDPKTEAKLRKVIEAYNVLKNSGLVK